MRLAHCQMPKFMDAKESKESFRRQTGLFLLYQPFLNHLRKPADVMQAKHKWDEFSEPDNPWNCYWPFQSFQKDSQAPWVSQLADS